VSNDDLSPPDTNHVTTGVSTVKDETVVEYQGGKTGLILFLTYVILGTITSPSWW
jgi:hypothetical protein